MKIVIPSVFVLMFGVFLPLFKFSRGAAHTVFKGLCTGTALALCMIGAVQDGSVFSWLMAAGLLFGLLGDVAIQTDFLRGMVFFFIGHAFYCAAFWLKKPPELVSLLIFIVLLCAVLLIGMKYFKQDELSIWPYIAYASIIIAMLALALPLFPKGSAGKAVAVGAVFFFISDAALAVLRFAPPKRSALLDAFSITCYYLGQFLLALSVCIPT